MMMMMMIIMIMMRIYLAAKHFHDFAILCKAITQNSTHG